MPIPRMRSRSTVRSLLIALLLCGAVAASAQADATYVYQGNDFTSASSPYSTSDQVTGTLVLSEALGADFAFGGIGGRLLSYDFTAGGDGQRWRVDSTSGECFQGSGFSAGTDSGGAITSWHILIEGDCGLRVTTTTDRGVFDSVSEFGGAPEIASVANNPGTWTLVPEPSTLSLSALGLLAFGVLRSGRRQVG